MLCPSPLGVPGRILTPFPRAIIGRVLYDKLAFSGTNILWPLLFFSSPLEALEEDACQLPEGDACTENTSVSFINSGVGSYYDLACDTELAAEGNLFGCDAGEFSFFLFLFL